MELAQKVTSMVLALRKKEHIIVRQPLACLSVPAIDAQQRTRLEAVKQLILDEVNVKEMRFIDGNMLEKTVKCNYRVMGKKFGKLMKNVAGAVSAMSQEEIRQLEGEGQILLSVDGNAVTVERADVDIVSEDIPGWVVANEGNVTVALDLTLTDELKNEGMAREIVKRIQTYRKESGLEITDRIHVKIENNPEIAGALSGFRHYVASQVLADTIELVDAVEGTTFDFGNFKVNVSIQKV